MANSSPAGVVKQVEGQVNRILRQLDWDEVTERPRKAVAELRQYLADARIYAQDYELSEMREEQLNNAEQAKKWLEQSRQRILRASEFNVFNPIEVAHLTALIEQISADLK